MPRQPPGPDVNEHYTLGPDSHPRAGVPKGELRGPFTLANSPAYPGTQHTYWIHVPAQYDPATPASLMVFQDGQALINPTGQLLAFNVLDNLIYRRELPVMITVFINPGRTPEQPEPNLSEWGDRTTNRPTEYNSLDDRYARVIVDELLPVLYKDYNISKDPEHHGIGGVSSGAIAAFTVAWERPDHFRKVLSIVGSFVNLRGGDAYPDIIRKSEKKPLRVFLQDGRNDNRGMRARRHLRSAARLVLSERADDEGADREGLRRQLHLGHGHPRLPHGRRHPPRDDALALARSRRSDRRSEEHGRTLAAARPSSASARLSAARSNLATMTVMLSWPPRSFARSISRRDRALRVLLRGQDLRDVVGVHHLRQSIRAQQQSVIRLEIDHLRFGVYAAFASAERRS